MPDVASCIREAIGEVSYRKRKCRARPHLHSTDWGASSAVRALPHRTTESCRKQAATSQSEQLTIYITTVAISLQTLARSDVGGAILCSVLLARWRMKSDTRTQGALTISSHTTADSSNLAATSTLIS